MFTEDAGYIDPVMSGAGQDGGPVAAGVDFALVADDGRLSAVTGFLEPAEG